VEITTKEARFKPKQDANVDMDDVKKAVADAGHARGMNYTVTDVKVPDKSTVKAPDKK
jgi:hypothetical protein